jgi:hypothetical protein
MITYFLQIAFTSIIGGITSPLLLLPDVSLPGTTSAGIATILNFLLIIKDIFPLTLSALFVAIGSIIVVENNIAIYKALRWAYSKIPGVN